MSTMGKMADLGVHEGQNLDNRYPAISFTVNFNGGDRTIKYIQARIKQVLPLCKIIA